MNFFSRVLQRPRLSPEQRALGQRRRLVKVAAVLLGTFFSLCFLAYFLIVTPSQLSGGEIGLIAILGAVLFGRRLVGLMRRVNIFRRR